ncbi:hypothetical protein COO60DRAFT_644623 [Scenedesmus sp. NREL 46B-D3]|nr:hypothetical protein COO60DRAFT_644623 [Scenedesmus sp. NREL 46B-D3]
MFVTRDTAAAEARSGQHGWFGPCISHTTAKDGEETPPQAQQTASPASHACRALCVLPSPKQLSCLSLEVGTVVSHTAYDVCAPAFADLTGSPDAMPRQRHAATTAAAVPCLSTLLPCRALTPMHSVPPGQALLHSHRHSDEPAGCAATLRAQTPPPLTTMPPPITHMQAKQAAPTSGSQPRCRRAVLPHHTCLAISRCTSHNSSVATEQAHQHGKLHCLLTSTCCAQAQHCYSRPLPGCLREPHPCCWLKHGSRCVQQANPHAPPRPAPLSCSCCCLSADAATAAAAYQSPSAAAAAAAAAAGPST